MFDAGILEHLAIECQAAPHMHVQLDMMFTYNWIVIAEEEVCPHLNFECLEICGFF